MNDSQAADLGARPFRFPPVFATNDAAAGLTVAETINATLRHVGAHGDHSVSIASAYFNLPGWQQIADALKAVPRVRLLLGAPPEPSSDQIGHRQTIGAEVEAARDLEAWLASERDRLAFTREIDEAVTELLDWLTASGPDEARRVEVRRPTGTFLHGKAFIVEHPLTSAMLVGSANLTLAGLTRNSELLVGNPESEPTDRVREWFDKQWADASDFDLADLFARRRADHPPELIFARMLAEMYGDEPGIGPDGPGEITDLTLTEWQDRGAETALAMMRSAGGALIADDVGLGKTHTAAKVVGYYTKRRARGVGAPWVLVVCPAALVGMWKRVLHEQGVANRVDFMSYDRARNRIDDLRRQRIEHPKMAGDFDKYAMVVCDEAHHLRNPEIGRTSAINWLIAGDGTPKHALLLTATPVNNGIGDLESLIGLCVRDDKAFADQGIASLSGYLRKARERREREALRPEDLFDLMRLFTVRHTRKFVQDNYADAALEDGTAVDFPERRIERIDYPPSPEGLRALEAVAAAAIGGDETPETDDDHRAAGQLIFARYRPSRYLTKAARARRELDDESVNDAFATGFIRSLLLKRLDSSPHALGCTLEAMIGTHEQFIAGLRRGRVLTSKEMTDPEVLAEVFGRDDDPEEQPDTREGEDDADDYRLDDYLAAACYDLDLLRRLREAVLPAEAADPKPEALAGYLREVAAACPGDGHADRLGRKVLVFSEYADTSRHVADRLREIIDSAPDGDPLALYRHRVPEWAVTGATRDTSRAIIASFDPDVAGTIGDRYDLVVSTDTLAEGVNMQAAGRCVNYDLPWNPMRVVQRYGRVDRLRSPHGTVDLRCFFPGDQLERWLNLIDKLQAKLADADAAIGMVKTLPFKHQASGGREFNAEAIRQFSRGDHTALDQEIGQALSAQEQQYRLGRMRSLYGAKIDALPHTAGSGFVNPAASAPAYVFCLRVGETGPVWFRTVFCDRGWKPASSHRPGQPSADGAAVDDRRSTALLLADPNPKGEDHPADRHLPDNAYAGAFDAWRIAQAHAHDAYRAQVRHENIPGVPGRFIQAAKRLRHLPAASPALARLRATPLSPKPAAEIGEILDTGADGEDLLARVEAVLDAHGIVAPQGHAELPTDLGLDDIRLICWQAVSTT